MSTFQAAFKNAGKFRFFNEIWPLALHLSTVTGHQFMSFEAEYPVEKELLKTKRGSGRGAKGIPCPFAGRNLRKLAYINVTANFSYAEKVEARGGERGESEGNWMQAVIYKGKITPLSTHKEDIITRVKDGIDPKSPEAEKWGNRVAVMDENGSIQFSPDCNEPRLYLRYEIIAMAGRNEEEKKDRNKRRLQSDSVYIIDAENTPVDRDELVDYLPVPQARKDQTNFQTTSLSNLVRLNAGGLSWQKLDYVYPVRAGESLDKVDQPMVDLILMRQDEIDAAREKAKAAAETGDIKKVAPVETAFPDGVPATAK